MTHVTEALELMLKLEEMSIPELILARNSTDNPKFISILDNVIDSKLPKN